MKKSIIALALSLPLFGASCFGIGEKVTDNLTAELTEKATEKVLESATGTENINIEGDTVSVEGEHGEQIEIGTNQLPDDFPTAVPIYDGAEPQSSFANGKEEGQAAWTVTLTSNDSVTKLNDFYATALTQNGWEITYNYSLEGSYGYVAKTQDLSVTVTISEGATGETDIFMSVSETTDSDE